MPAYSANRLKSPRLGYRIMRELLQQSLPPGILAKRIGVGKITIYRHIYAMQAQGIPVEVWRVEGSKYRYVLDREKFWAWCGGQSVPPKRRSNAKHVLPDLP